MDFNRWVFKSIFFLTLKLRREWFIPYLNDLKKTQYWSQSELKELQTQKLKKLLTHSRKNIPYYKNKIPENINSLNDLPCLPLLDKDQIRRRPDEFMWKKGIHQRLKTSGGSTGAPVTLLKDSHGMAQELAATWRGYGWAGIKIGDRQARFWGEPRNKKDKWRAALIDLVCHRIRITAFGYDDNTLSKAVKYISRFNPDYFYGYVSILRDFAEYYDANREVEIKPKSIIATSEVLTKIDRENIENVFGAKVFDEYGCGEIGTIAHECEYGGMHISCENIILEVLDSKGQPAQAGESGEIVVTDLTNYSMPLIRYQLKDFATLSKKNCRCGRSLPMIEKIHGRQYDTLKNSRGVSFHGEFFLYMVEDIKKDGIGINGVQFIQKSNLDIIVNVVIDYENLHEFSNYIKKRIQQDFDPNIEVTINKVDFIKRDDSGKLRVVKRI